LPGQEIIQRLTLPGPEGLGIPDGEVCKVVDSLTSHGRDHHRPENRTFSRFINPADHAFWFIRKVFQC